MIKRLNTTIRNKKKQRTGNRKLTRYIHSRNYSKLSGYRGMRPIENIRRNRLLLAIVTITIIVVGTLFVFK